MAKRLNGIQPFDKPIYVTRPLLPDKDVFFEKIKEIWGSGWLTNNGTQHQLLESELKNLLKVPALSLFNNGTIALIVACQSLRVSGDVITTPFTFAATPHVLTWNNITPIFCDIDPVTLNIDPERIESMITPKTTAILGVHVFGIPCNVAHIQDIADRYGLKVIYDAAHAFNVELDGHGIGNYGDITMFSFHATKLFHTAEGGALAFKDGNLKGRIDLLKNFGIKNEDEVVMPGINGKMNEMQAALGLVVLEELDAERERRRRVREIYERELGGMAGLRIVRDDVSTKQSYQYLPIIVDEQEFGCSRDYLYERLQEYNVFSRKYFYPLCSDYTCYRQLPSSSPGNLPVANAIVNSVLALPFYGELAGEDVITICHLIKELRPS
jgi:dTDP-4-amino-4,6-dideoxygalactose transaminase